MLLFLVVINSLLQECVEPKALRDKHDRAIDRLEGIIPVVEDWHARMTLLKVNFPYGYIYEIVGNYRSPLQVIWKQLFNPCSS